MKKIVYTLVILFLFSYSICAQDESVIVKIFDNAPIQFGDITEGETWVSEDNGRIVSHTVTMPEFDYPVKIIARLTLESDGDPWDRFGTVYLIQEDSPNIELLKFMTGFGTGLSFKQNNIPSHSSVKEWARNVILEQDVTELANLLKGEVTIKAMIDTWVKPGWLIDFELVYQPQETAKRSNWIYSLFNNTAQYWTSDKFTEENTTIEVTVPEGLSNIKMYYYTSGHGGQSTGDEFNKKDNVIYIDDKEVLRFIPWRDDCRLYRRFSPISAKWQGDLWSSDLSRSNWSPGDQVRPMIFELGKYLKSGKHTIRFSVENMGVSTEGNLNYWNISAFLVGYEENLALSENEDIIPYIQTPTPNSINICWSYDHDFSSFVEYGTTKDLGNILQGNNEIIGDKIVWHCVKLEDLKPDTLYYYKVRSGIEQSKVYQFKTLPKYGDNKGHIRIGVLGGNNGDAEIFTKLINAMKVKMVELYGEDLLSNIDLIFNTGDIFKDGEKIEKYVPKYFKPMGMYSTNIPVQITPGDSDKESMYLYQFVKNDEFDSADGQKSTAKSDEEYYKFQLGRALFVSLNGNVLSMNQVKWFEEVMANADQSEDIDNIFIFEHQPIYMKSKYLRKKMLSALEKTNKPTLFINGHANGYEHGSLKDTDLEWVIIGKEVGLECEKKPSEVEILNSSTEYCYGILDIDLLNKSYIFKIYSIGSEAKENILIDELSYTFK